MQYFIILLSISFVFFLFTLYAYSRDDFILFRKNIEMEKIFNLAFLVAGAGLFFARFFYVALNFSTLYLNPLAFLLFPYFPGLSLPGGVLGGSLVLIFLLKGKKFPEGRIFDFFIIAFLASTLIGELIFLGVSYAFTKTLSIPIVVQTGIVFLLFILSARASRNHSLKEGSVGIMSIMLLSLLFIPTFFIERPMNVVAIAKESSLWLVNFIIASIFFFRQDSLFLIVRMIRGK